MQSGKVYKAQCQRLYFTIPESLQSGRVQSDRMAESAVQSVEWQSLQCRMPESPMQNGSFFSPMAKAIVQSSRVYNVEQQTLLCRMLDSPVFTMQTCRVYCRMAESLEQSGRVYSAVCERLRVYILLSSSSLHSDNRLPPVQTVQHDILLFKTKKTKNQQK